MKLAYEEPELLLFAFQVEEHLAATTTAMTRPDDESYYSYGNDGDGELDGDWEGDGWV